MQNGPNVGGYVDIATIKQASIDGVDTDIAIQRQIPGAVPVKEFISTGEATKIKMLASGDDIFAPIKSSELIINTWNIENFDALSSLAGNSNREVRAIVEREGITIWSGFLVPNQWYEPFTTTPYPTQITFVNGISFLKNIDFVQPDGTYWRGKESGVGLIAYLLSQTGIRRRFVDQINIIDEGTDPADIRGTLFEKFYDLEAFRGMNCYEVLEMVLRSLLSRIEYYNDKFYIKRFSDFSSSVRSYEYEIQASGAILQSTYNYSRLEEITPAKSNRIDNFSFVTNDAELSIVPGRKKLNVTHNYGKKDSIFPRSLFDDDDFLSNGRLKYYNTSIAVNKTESNENEIYAFFDGRLGPDQIYLNPDFIEGQTETNYDPSNQYDDLFEEFTIDFNFRNISYRPNQGLPPYYGPILRSDQKTSVGTNVRPANDSGQSNLYTKTEVKGYFNAGISISDSIILDNIIKEDVTAPGGYKLNEPFYIRFTNQEKVPPDLKVGIYYYCVLIDVTTIEIGGGTVVVDASFGLKETTNILEAPITFSESINNITYEAETYIDYFKIKYGTQGTGLNLGLDGDYKSDGFLIVGIDPRDSQSKDNFSQGYESTERYITIEGKLNIRIERIIPNIRSKLPLGNYFFGAYAIESFKVQFKECPEKGEEEITLNSNFNQEFDLTIDFAEVPIYTNFKNAVLRYFNVFYSRSLTSAPGLQYYHGVEANGTADTIYNLIVNEHKRLLQKNRFAITGTLHSAEKQFFDKLIAETYTKKLYICVYVEWDLYNNYHNVEMKEIGNYVQEGDGSGNDWNDDWNNDF